MKRALAVSVVGALAIITALSCEKKQSLPSETSVPALGGTPLKAVAPASSRSEATRLKISPPPKRQLKYFPEGTPTRAIQDLDDMLETYILNPKTDEEKRYNTELKRQVLHGTFDIRELSRLALDKHWRERSAKEQDFFVDLLIRLLERKAVFSKEQGQQKKGSKPLYRITYEGDRYFNLDKTQALVRSMVHIPSEDLKIDLNYKVKKLSAEGGWKIYDVIVDEASLLDNYKYQFDKIISKDGYSALVHRMESKLKSLMEENHLTASEPQR